MQSLYSRWRSFPLSAFVAGVCLLSPAAAQLPGAAAEDPAATAQEPEAPQTPLAALLQEAEAASPVIRAAAARLEAASRVPSRVQAPPDPEATIGYTNDGLSDLTLGEREFSMLSLGWSQELPYPGKLKAAGEVAMVEAEIAARDLDRLRFAVAAAVKTAYADLYRIDRARGILVESQVVLESVAQTARRRYEVGEGIQENILKAQTQILRLEAERARLEQERRAAEARLGAAVGRASGMSIGAVTSLPQEALPEDREALANLATAASPEIDRLVAGVRRAEAGLRLARLELKPDFLWSARYDHRGDLDPMVTGTFGWRLPAHRQRKQAQAVAEAEANFTAARMDLESRQVQALAEVRDLVSRVERAERLLALFDQGVIPQARSALESAQASYRVGRLDLLDLLNDLSVLLEAQVEHAAQEAERFQALAALEALIGRGFAEARLEEAPASPDAVEEGVEHDDH
jgi:outer membrane protein TolC